MPNRVTTRSSSEAAYYSSSTTTRTKFVVATPGWRELVILPSSGEEDGSHLLEDTSDEAYERRHRLVELKERYNLLVYEFNRSIRASKKKKLSKDVSEELRPAADNMSAEELEEAISRLAANKAPSETSRPSRLKRKARRIRFTSGSGSSSFSSSSFSVLSDASRTSLASTSAKSSPSSPIYRSSYATVAVVRLDDCLCSADSVDISDTTTIAKSRSLMITRGQARQIQELNIAKLCSCDFTLESLESIAEDGSGPKSKRTKIDHHSSNSTTTTATTTSSPSKLQSQLKQIENIEKTAIELSLTQNKMLRTTKQDMNKSQSLDDLMATTSSYSHFYRRIN